MYNFRFTKKTKHKFADESFQTVLICILVALGVTFSSCSVTKITDRGVRAEQKHKYDKAAKLYTKAANKGNRRAQANLADLYYFGKGVSKNHKEAAKWYNKAANQGSSQAQFALGVMYWNGDGVKKDESESLKWYRKAANNGNTSAQFNLGIILKEQNDQEAIKWFREIYNADWAEVLSPIEWVKAGINLGDIYRDGVGVSKNPIKARLYYDKVSNLCKDSNLKKIANDRYEKITKYINDNAFTLGNNSYYGYAGYEKDKKNAIYYWIIAANNGNAKAQYYLGLCYSQGDGVSVDKKKAFEWFSKSANRAYAPAQYNLGCYYYDGIGGAPKDRSLARKWFEKAADQGDEDAKGALSQMNKGSILGGLAIGVGAALIGNAIFKSSSKNSSSSSSSSASSSSNKNSGPEPGIRKMKNVEIVDVNYHNGNLVSYSEANIKLRNMNSYNVP